LMNRIVQFNQVDVNRNKISELNFLKLLVDF